MNLRCSSRLLQFSALAFLASACLGNYIITTPRKWSSGETVQICLFIMNSTSTSNTLTVTLESQTDNSELIPRRTINIPAGKAEHCDRLTLPNLGVTNGLIKLSGHVGGQIVGHERNIKFAGQVTKTFVQTDKYLYKPGQKVQFRILTLSGPFIKISTNKYPLVWVETPTGSRIAQWVDLDNSDGLIHQTFTLSDEPEKGVYKIHADSPDGGYSAIQEFKVDEFTLPRFEVTVTAPRLIFGNTEEFTFNVCAEYTYGQPVNGNVTLQFDNNGWGSSRKSFLVTQRISGCKDFLVTAEDVALNHDYYQAHKLMAKATVTEDGTGEEFKGETSADIHRTPYKFKVVGDEKYVKPGLPYTGKVKVEFPDGSAATGEVLEVCAHGNCKNVTADSAGILTFVIPQYLDHNINIKSLTTDVEAPRRSRFSSWRRIMHPAQFHHHVKRYYSPSRSSLVIHAPTTAIPCTQGESHTHLLPLLYAVTNQNYANITVQIVSRGQIQFSKTAEYQLITTPLPLDGTLLSPMPPVPDDTRQGSITLPLTLPPTASPSAKVIVWFDRHDGEVVSDARELKVDTCYTNPVTLNWSSSKAHPGDQVDINLSSEPQSICSLGVVDKSVELLSSTSDPLTVSGVFGVVEKAMVGASDNPQVDNSEYCRSKKMDTIEGPWRRSIWRPRSYTDYVDALQMFDDSGLFIFSDLTVETRPCNEREFYPVLLSTRLGAAAPPGLPMAVALPELAFSGSAGMDLRPGEPGPVVSEKSSESSVATSQPRTYFPETWLWQLSVLPWRMSSRRRNRPVSATHARQRTSVMKMESVPLVVEEHRRHSVDEVATPINQKVRSYFPETWLWKLANIGATGVRSESVTLPHTITEWVGKAVCVHPERGLGVSPRASVTTFTPFFIDLTLPPSVKRGETLNVKISVFNYLEADLPVRVVLEPSFDYEILDEPVNEIDAVNEAAPEGGFAGGLLVARPSLEAAQRRSCVTAQDKTVHTVRLRPTMLGEVNITVWAEVDSLYPDVCGPEYILSKRDHLVKPIKVELEGFPKEKTWTKYICSKDIEENSDFLERWSITAPADIVPDSARGWITAVGDLLGPTLENLGSLVKMPYGCGEQNMLNFAPNIFILQYLETTQQTTPEIAEKSIEYMKQGYQRELQYRHSDGSYSAFGSSDAEGSTWLTAFVLKSFAQARQFIQIDSEDINMSREWIRLQQMENGCFMSKGKVFHKGMKGGIDSEGSPVPLSAYILVSLLESGEVATSRTVSEAAFCLVADKAQDPYTLALKSYALALADAPEARDVIQQLVALATETTSSMHWELPAGSGKSKAVAVEAAGYTILAMTTLDAELYNVQTRKIVKWISSQRNGQGGFHSTQDTVVALQALASFESNEQKGNGTDLVVTVDAGTLQHNFHINETNKLLQQSASLPSSPVNVFLDLVGEGCALIQAVLRYNIPEGQPSEAFSLSVKTKTKHDPLCLTKSIIACASYQLPDNTSNMAVIEVNLVSGYIPEKADLKRIVGYGTGIIKRYEVDGSQVTFYVDEFTRRETCVDFRIIRQVDVEDVKPGTVKVYDYYQPEYFSTQSYTLPPTDECLTDPEPVEIDGIIIDPIVVEGELEETGGQEDRRNREREEAIDDLLVLVDEMP